MAVYDNLDQLFQQEILMATAGRNAAEAYEKLTLKLDASAKAAKAAAAATAAAAEATAKVAKAQKEWDDKVKASVSGFKGVTSALIGADAALTGFAAAASPDAFRTLTGNIQLLSATIGKAYMPALAQTITWIDRARRYVEGLDQDMLKNVATWVSVAGAVGIAAKGFMVLAGAIGAIPAAAATAVTALTALASARQMGSQAKVDADLKPTTAKDIAKDKEIQDILGSFETDKIRQQQLADLARERGEKATKANAAAGKDARTPSWMLGMNDFFLSPFGKTPAQKREEAASGATKAHERAVEAMKIFATGATDQKTFAESAKKSLPAGEDGKKVPPVAIPKEMMPAFNAIEGARRGVQLAGLGNDPIQQELLKTNRESYAKMIDKLNEIADNTKDPAGFGP